MSGKIALSLIHSMEASTETTVTNDVILNNEERSTSVNKTVADGINITSYKCISSCSTALNDGNSNSVKNFLKSLKNIPCDRAWQVNRDRRSRNFHKLDLQYVKNITQTTMFSKTIKYEILTEDIQID
ncbi:unnamed protein product [Rotaria sp. Silwood1]|nr:unnamed protein product [Rotaria sp. Silwood1]CAF1422291.1 unnamed protein product [Rotaria sp. Silwood1]CAF3628695.1 unnamed protein product [Rotaria sp. Silwood1]CAF3654040.1 unnamed protein product [Rotaria sp. Silwood1]CAF4918012.1 unnamed protein product [Rotaria sp. Silwood1]